MAAAVAAKGLAAAAVAAAAATAGTTQQGVRGFELPLPAPPLWALRFGRLARFLPLPLFFSFLTRPINALYNETPLYKGCMDGALLFSILFF